MKIVQITTDNREQQNDYDNPTPHFGTAPQGLLDGFTYLDGIEVHVVSCSKKRINVPKRLSHNVFFHQPVVPKIGWGRTAFLGCVTSVRKILKTIKPDIVHGQGTERDCSMNAVFSGYPNVITIHGNMRVHAKRPEQAGNHYYKMASALESLCLKRTDGVIAISNYTRELVSGMASRTWVIPNAVDQRFFNVQTDATLPIPRILFVGSLDPRKNPLGLLQACTDMLTRRECEIAFAGQFCPDTPYGHAVLALMESLPGVSILGFLDRESLAYEFSRSTILVLPTFEDNCPMVVLEAMAAGIPIAASAVGGIPEIVSNEVDGLLFDPHHQEDITNSIRSLIKNPSQRAGISAACREKAIRLFHPRTIAEAHIRAYEDVLTRKRNESRHSIQNR
jgi:glycosyltransferase involved in cell wall biosynthesis